MVTNSTIKKTRLSMHFSEMPGNKVIGCKVDLSCQNLQVYLNGNWIIIPRTLPWCSTSHKHFLSEWQSVRPSACPILLIEHITIMVTTSLWIFLIYFIQEKNVTGWPHGKCTQLTVEMYAATGQFLYFFFFFLSDLLPLKTILFPATVFA